MELDRSARRTIESKFSFTECRFDEVEIDLRVSKKTTEEWESRFKEVSSSVATCVWHIVYDFLSL